MTSKRRLTLRLLITLVLLLPALPAAAPGANADDSADGSVVKIGSDRLEPSAISVAAGSAVTWVNDTDFTATLTSDTNLWPAQQLPPDNGWWSFTFTNPGTYGYHVATRNEDGQSMTFAGTVTVTGSSSPPPATATPTATTAPPPPTATATPTAPPPPPPSPTATTPPPPTATPTATTPPPPPPPTATPTPPPPTTYSITIGNDFFSPQVITIPVGSTVTWTDTGSIHNVFDDGATYGTTKPAGAASFMASGTFLNTGQTYTYTFTVPGTYYYVCQFHQPNMNGTITVQ